MKPQSPRKSEKIKPAVLLGLTGAMVFPILVNLFLVLAIDPLGELIIDPEIQGLIDQVSHNFWVEFVARVLPFPFLALAQGIYGGLFLRKFWAGKTWVTAGRRAVKSLLALPWVMGVISVAGWVFGGGAFLISGPLILGQVPGIYYLENMIELLVLAYAGMVLTFYGTETILRRVLVPRLFQRNQILEVRAGLTQSIRSRLVVFAISAGLAPTLLFGTTILILNNQGQNPLGRDLTSDVILVFFGFLGILALVTWLKTKTIEAPLRQLKEFSQKLGAGDFSARVTVSSDDEIGAVGGCLNDMAQGLEERERMRQIFGRVVDPRVRDQLLSQTQGTGGIQKRATVVFFDLQGFTTFSENHTPQEVVNLLNQWFDMVTRCVEAEEGLVNKFIGDGVLAVFGVPLDIRNHAERALRCVEALKEVHQGPEGLKNLGVAFRAGVHTGEVLAGIVGSRDRQEFTVIGDAVNVASRLESMGKEYGASVLVSQATWETCLPGRKGRSLGAASIRGRQEKLGLFSLE